MTSHLWPHPAFFKSSSALHGHDGCCSSQIVTQQQQAQESEASGFTQKRLCTRPFGEMFGNGMTTTTTTTTETLWTNRLGNSAEKIYEQWICK
mmetsp:Transcript_47390/g.102080  ORF Transcript_47390/g.102080 Transcript_47390/m.102080 type:complete len:93 (+) Transcript_47390:2468-2746(+)